jgi:hypothetical protein
VTDIGAHYETLDEQLQRRADYYPAHREPDWSRLQGALAAATRLLWAGAAGAEPEQPTTALESLAEHPIFVVGYYKSGTTLLLSLLDGHPELIALPGESRHFTSFVPRTAGLAAEDRIRELHAAVVRNAITPYGLPPHWLLGRPLEESADPYDVLGKRLVGLARARGSRDLLGVTAQALAIVTGGSPRLWVEKTPLHELHVDEIVAAYPEARFIHVLREPHSTIESIVRFDAGRPLVDPLTGSSELAQSFAAARAGRTRLGERYLLVRYDELVTDTRGTMERLASCLDVAFDERLLTPTTLGLPSTANAGRPERRVSGAVHTLSLGDTRSEPLRRRMLVDALVGQNARALGFETPRGNPVVALAARAALFARYRIGAR